MSSVYRFHDCAAVHTAGPTRYISAKDARTLAKALLSVARSIEREPFTRSTCGTVSVPDFDSASAATRPPMRHTVRVESYSLEAGAVGQDARTLYESNHKTARSAARRLAEMINRKTALALSIPRGQRFTVDGYALTVFRARYGVRA